MARFVYRCDEWGNIPSGYDPILRIEPQKHGTRIDNKISMYTKDGFVSEEVQTIIFSESHVHQIDIDGNITHKYPIYIIKDDLVYKCDMRGQRLFNSPPIFKIVSEHVDDLQVNSNIKVRIKGMSKLYDATVVSIHRTHVMAIVPEISEIQQIVNKKDIVGMENSPRFDWNNLPNELILSYNSRDRSQPPVPEEATARNPHQNESRLGAKPCRNCYRFPDEPLTWNAEGRSVRWRNNTLYTGPETIAERNETRNRYEAINFSIEERGYWRCPYCGHENRER
jgi:hypothetical protein